MLSFLFYELLANPEAYRDAQEEVDRVIGKQPVTIDHMSKLPYIEACLRETLRLHPTAPGFTLQAKGVQVLQGKYLVKDKEIVAVNLPQVHRDPEVYGSDSEQFKPARTLEEAFGRLPPDAWKVSLLLTCYPLFILPLTQPSRSGIACVPVSVARLRGRNR